MTKDELMDKFCSVFNEATTANDAEDIKISLLAFKKAFTVLADVNPRMAKEVLECYEGTLKYYNFLTENEAEEIADFIANDFLAENSTLDWKDDAEHGGDISDAFALIRSKTDPNQESVKQNFKAFLQSCVKNILSNRDIFDKECSEAVNLFSVWRNQGRWRPE